MPFTAHFTHIILSLFNENVAGGLLLATLATTSSILDHYLRSINLGFSISFTSVLIIVSILLQALLSAWSELSLIRT